MSTTTQSVTHAEANASVLRNLYLTRAAFAVIWAAVFTTTGSSLSTLAAVLLVLYPAVDAAAAVVDARVVGSPTARAVTITNIVISVTAAAGLAAAASGSVPDVLRVWGAWAIASGLVQLVGAVRRRTLAGQRFLMASGGLSVLAGASFAASAAEAGSMTGLAGYALLGSLFFLVSALRLGRVRASQEA